MVLVGGEVLGELGRRVRVPGAPGLMVYYLTLHAKIRVNIGNQPVERLELLLRIGTGAAHVHDLYAHGPCVHPVVRKVRANGDGAEHVVATVLLYPVELVVTGVSVARVVRDAVERHALDDVPVLPHHEVGGNEVAVARPPGDGVLGAGIPLSVVQHDVALVLGRLGPMVELGADVLDDVKRCVELVGSGVGRPRLLCRGVLRGRRVLGRSVRHDDLLHGLRVSHRGIGRRVRASAQKERCDKKSDGLGPQCDLPRRSQTPSIMTKEPDISVNALADGAWFCPSCDARRARRGVWRFVRCKKSRRTRPPIAWGENQQG